MKIILLDDVSKVGRRGEVREVSDGYARNFLIPKKLALSATAGNLKNLEHIKTQQDAKADRAKADAESLRSRVEALVYEERRQASEEGKLFGSVTSQDIADFLVGHGLKIDRRRLTLDEPIKTLGEFSVSMRLHPEVTAQLRVTANRATATADLRSPVDVGVHTLSTHHPRRLVSYPPDVHGLIHQKRRVADFC